MSADSEELARFFTLFPDMLCIAGTDGFFKRLNPSWSRMLGWSADELLARPYLDFVHADDRDATVREASDISAGHTAVNFENRYRCRDGSYKWLQWTAVLFEEEQRIYAIARDVTALKTAGLELRTTQQQLARASQAKSEFLSRMSHELRTPLNAIMGFAQVLKLDPLEPEQLDSVTHILRGGRHLLKLINEVLDIARIEAGRLSLSPEPVALAEIVNHAVDLIRPLAAQRNLAITVETRPSNYAFADRQRLYQILFNLLSNAVKYNREGGSIHVSAGVPDPQRVRIVVADTGTGISAAKLALLFTPFERLGAEQSEMEGIGLGLAVSKGLAEAMKGSLTAQSVVDQGTEFHLELPVCTAEPAQVGTAVGTSLDVTDCSGTVLYIEDNVSNVQLMQRLLVRRPRVELLHAPDGRTGLAVVRERRPALVFLDLHLPDMPGEEVLRQIWESPTTRGIPIVVLSADATPAQKRRLLASGALTYLTKPFDITDVLEVVDRVLGASA